MSKSKKKRAGVVVAATLGLFVEINVIISDWDDTFGTALVACHTRGWRNGELALSRSNISQWVVGQSAVFEFTTTNRTPAKTIRVILRKPINLMDWRVVDYEEE